MRSFIYGGIFAMVLVAVAAFTSAPASADFQVCNESGEHIAVAIAYYDELTDSYVSEGWWNIDSGSCKTPVSGKLQNEYYYLYAESDQHTWTGGHSMCLDPVHEFTLYDVDTSCDYSYKDFFRVDTGDYVSYTETIR